MAGLLAAATPRASLAAVIQIDVRALFDADVVVNNGGGPYDPTQDPIDSGSTGPGNFALMTASVAAVAAGPGETPDGLPDDGFFAASGFYPDVQLGWSNGDDGVNARRLDFAAGSFGFDVPPGSYAALHLYMTTGDGDSDVTVELRYDDLSVDMQALVVPDWFDDPAETAARYRLFDGGDRIQPGSGPGVLFDFEDSNDTAIFGFRLAPDPARTLVRVDIVRSDALGVLNFFGAVAETVAAGPDLYETTDKTSILQAANIVAMDIPTPHQHTPAAPPTLYYQVDDGSGSPPLIRMVKRGGDVEIVF